MTEYIDWAVKDGFGVMDINVPAYCRKDEVRRSNSQTLFRMLTRHALQDNDPYHAPAPEAELTKHLLSLMCYLWDNYIQLFQAEELFLMGVGNAYLGIKILLINRSIHPHIFPRLFSPFDL